MKLVVAIPLSWRSVLHTAAIIVSILALPTLFVRFAGMPITIWPGSLAFHLPYLAYIFLVTALVTGFLFVILPNWKLSEMMTAWALYLLMETVVFVLQYPHTPVWIFFEGWMLGILTLFAAACITGLAAHFLKWAVRTFLTGLKSAPHRE